MRKRVLGLERKLGAGQPRVEILEMRVVAEPGIAARRIDDDAVPAALGRHLRVGRADRRTGPHPDHPERSYPQGAVTLQGETLF